MKTIIFIALFLLIASQTQAGEPWNKTDKILFGSSIALSVIDAFQTDYIFDHPESHHELNPILDHYGGKAVIPYFTGMKILEYLVADNLKPSWRRNFLIITNTVQVQCVRRNYVLGVRFDLK